MPDSKAHVVLDACHYATKADLTAFRQLISRKSGILELELILRILLTYLPESTEPSVYIPLLQELSSGAPLADKNVTVPKPITKDIGAEEAKRRVRKLKLRRLDDGHIFGHASNLIERFLFCRAYRIDSEIGALGLIEDLIRPFITQYIKLATWNISTLLPLQRIQQSRSQDSQLISLSSIGKIRGRAGLEIMLISGEEAKGFDYSPRLRNIIGPWLYGETVKTGWESNSADTALLCWNVVNEWLLALAGNDFESAVQTYTNWNGPSDVDYGDWTVLGSAKSSEAAESAYQQLGLALVYASPDTGDGQRIDTLLRIDAKRTQHAVLDKSRLKNITAERSTIQESYLSSISNLHLSQTELLEPANPLTRPSEQSILFTQLSMISASMLSSLGIMLTIERTVHLALFESAKAQWGICSKVIHNLPSVCGKQDPVWIDAQEKLFWLRDWKTDVQPGHARQGIFSQVDLEQLHFAVLESLITHGRYKLAIESYCNTKSKLPVPKVKDALINVILASYDNASNGNKTRGGIKKAAEIITTFRPHFPEFQRMNAMWALVQATHRLSFYSLTLQHGIPLSPVNIRIHPEPLTLIDKVLQQNPGSYTKLDDLLDIGRDLVKAGRIEFSPVHNAPLSEQDAIHQVEQSITAKAISASLSESDFDTAYSYIVNRLSTMSSSDTSSNDHLWRAAYQAGRYSSQTKSSTSPSALRRLEQRMELLSQALLLAPTSSLQEVLATWRECERNLNSALALESREEDAWQAKGDRILPGGFSEDEIAPVKTKAREHTRRAMDEEAPMGLFDVARGAAAALSKSAFPLRGQATRTSGEAARSDEEAPQRVRKRDMVSNMVTGGLASGIGWVIGAPPVNHDG